MYRWKNGTSRLRTFVDSRAIDVRVSGDVAFAAVCSVGGENGWFGHDWLWRLRGALDRLAGGIGLRRGRPQGRQIRVGDTIDFWRVEQFEAGRLLRLHGEMKVPGEAWLEFEVVPARMGGSSIRLSAIFKSAGLLGDAYWIALYPFHHLIFTTMLTRLAQSALDAASEAAQTR